MILEELTDVTGAPEDGNVALHSCTSVCSKWSGTANKILYRSISITSQDVARQLLAGGALGVCKTIEIGMGPPDVEPTELVPIQWCGEFYEVLARLPNLEGLYTRHGLEDVPPTFLSQLPLLCT